MERVGWDRVGVRGTGDQEEGDGPGPAYTRSQPAANLQKNPSKPPSAAH